MYLPSLAHFRKRVCPSPRGVPLRVRGWGSTNSDDWRKSLVLCRTLPTLWEGMLQLCMSESIHELTQEPVDPWNNKYTMTTCPLPSIWFSLAWIIQRRVDILKVAFKHRVCDDCIFAIGVLFCANICRGKIKLFSERSCLHKMLYLDRLA